MYFNILSNILSALYHFQLEKIHITNGTPMPSAHTTRPDFAPRHVQQVTSSQTRW